MKDKRGFNIVEMAIVLVVVGMLIAIGVVMLIPLTNRMKHKETEKTIADAAEAVIGFADINHRLPTAAEFIDVAVKATDTWGNNLVYIPDPNLVIADSICVANASDTEVDVCGDPSCATPIDNADNSAFLILSAGPNLNIQTNTAVSPIKVYNEGLPGIDDYTPVMNRPQSYDDIFKWVVLPELRLRAGCEGSLLRILENPLPSGLISQAYDTDIFATGGVPWADGGDADAADDYRWCVTASLPDGLSYSCNGALVFSASCGWDAATATETGTWQQCTSLEISGTPATSGSFSLPVYARDNADNTDMRSFAFTISQISGLNICPQYRAWNVAPGTHKDYLIRAGSEPGDPISGACDNVPLNDEITAHIKTLMRGEVLEQWQTSNATCATSMVVRLTYNQAIALDTNGDCCLEFLNNVIVEKVCP
ncbi:MAG: prepilin-type N-terminal cleavage/methylation domain-containing protein [Thermodesulfovibrionia bacterium]|nr:prepilin-type N-terminal cleavage/methylation domain-containing protein [Thermodesulfovibrionia bacterium]